MLERTVSSSWTTKLKSNADMGFVAVAVTLLLIDLLTASEIIEALAFVLIVGAFLVTAIPKRVDISDERLRHMKLWAGYMSLMVSICVVGVCSFLLRYTDFSAEASDLLRYVSLSMFLTFAALYAVAKRVF